MATTIWANDGTRERLARYKEAVGAATYEETIVRHLWGSEEESAFGSMRGWGPWSDEARIQTRSDEREV